MIRATLFVDPACPWGYSANPAHRVLEWRYGDGLDWRLVTIGLREEPSTRPWDAGRSAAQLAYFRHQYGMPFSLTPKGRPAATGRGCRAVVAAALDDPGSEWKVLRALYFANFTTPLLLDDDAMIRDALDAAGLDGDAIVARLDNPDVAEAYERDRVEARSAAGTAAEAQGKTAASDGPVRYTAPSIIFERDGEQLVAGGWQPVMAYDVLIANLEPALERREPPETAVELLERFPGGLTTAEAAAVLCPAPDYVASMDDAEAALVKLVAAGAVTREPLGQDALWKPAAATARHAGKPPDAAALLAAYDAQLRTHVHDRTPSGVEIERDGPLLRTTGFGAQGWIEYRDLGGLDGRALDELIARQVDFFAARGQRFEWKLHGHDLPTDLPGRLRAAGFVPEGQETVMIGSVEPPGVPDVPAGVRIREVLEPADFTAVAALEAAVWDEDHGWLDGLAAERRADPEGLRMFLAEADGRAVSAGWVRFPSGTEFATFWGGATLPEWRGRGIYRALVAHRARLAAERGRRYLEVDASDDSRPILARLGFVAVTTTTPYVWSP